MTRHTAYMREWRKRNPDNAADNRRWAKESRKRNIDEVRAYDRERPHRCAPQKINAHKVVHAAIAKGELVRPDSCEGCGTAPEPCFDGRTAIQAHHDDYDKPLDVRWLCTSCHGAEHRKWA